MAANLNPNPNPNVVAVADDNQPPHGDEPKDPRWFWLTVVQYLLIAAVTIVFVWVLARGINNTSRGLEDMATARGLITFVIAVSTVAIAMMLTLTAIVTRDFDKRIAVGKEILTILVGVLGTIVGFYYGAATKESASPASQISAAAITITPPELARDGKITLSTTLSGGTPPYSYTIIFTPDTIPAVPQKESVDGKISEEISGAAVPPGTKEIVFRIEGKDKNGVAFAINKDGTQKIPVR